MKKRFLCFDTYFLFFAHQFKNSCQRTNGFIKLTKILIGTIYMQLLQKKTYTSHTIIVNSLIYNGDLSVVL